MRWGNTSCAHVSAANSQDLSWNAKIFHQLLPNHLPTTHVNEKSLLEVGAEFFNQVNTQKTYF